MLCKLMKPSFQHSHPSETDLVKEDSQCQGSPITGYLPVEKGYLGKKI